MGLFSSIGGIVNDITGVSSSASQSNKYAVQNAYLNHKFQKEFAQNGHQWEADDLEKAGLNRALTATGGSGASASGGGSFGGSTGGSAGNPLDLLNGIIGMRNQTSATKSQNDLNAASAIKIIAETKNIPFKNKIEMMNAISNEVNANANATNAETNKNTAKGGVAAKILGNDYNIEKGIKGWINAYNKLTN